MRCGYVFVVAFALLVSAGATHPEGPMTDTLGADLTAFHSGFGRLEAAHAKAGARTNRTSNSTSLGENAKIAASANPTPSPPPATTYTPPTTLHCANNCSYHGECVRVAPNSNRGKCVCDKMYGRSSLHVVQDCSEVTLDMCPESCRGRGICIPTNSSMVCQCYDGFHGESCESYSRCEKFSFCNGHGACTHSYPLNATEEEACVCNAGYTGPSCAQTVVGCPDVCSGHGICTTAESGLRSCDCDAGFGGHGCNRVVPPFCENSCSGLGRCQADLTCKCAPGTTGSDCSEITNECENCHHGFCRSGKCECLSGFTGTHCNVYNATTDLECRALNFCNGRGVCHRSVQSSGLYGYGCTCFEGFSGANCGTVDVNYEDQCPNYCSGQGKCVLLEVPHCSCNEGFNGTDCSHSMCPKTGGQICSGRGVCEKDAENKFHCVCDAGYEKDASGACGVSLCPNDCNDHGTCNATGSCICSAGWTGLDCSISSASQARQVLAEAKPALVSAVTPMVVEGREDEEQGSVMDPSSCLNACSKHGDCVMGSCVCFAGRGGDDCSSELPSAYEENDDLDKLDLLEIKSSSESMAALWD